MDKERQVLEDLILGTDTNDVRTLWEKADSWLSENNFDVAELKEDYPDDPVGCVADCVGSLDHKEVQKQLKKHLSADEIKKRVAAK